LEEQFLELQVMGGYFVHFLAPEGMEPMPMDIVFVLDKSGSMGGTKMKQLQDSMIKILDDVKPDDRIMIIVFSSSHTYWKSDFRQATASNIDDAKTYIRQLYARGGKYNDSLKYEKRLVDNGF
jgi:secreted protein with Ig-like and vWFA domain